ncbi:putative amidase [Venturia nashicola]|uniref:Putative amidase n=1 Tax=Venturia nashicola TaxID=86259 RepID=A0A4Z1NT44_9PEZI|nr:putative amidase [Venturia nashicola]TLD29616.1 putative amidase [Venturia nashicola]
MRLIYFVLPIVANSAVVQLATRQSPATGGSLASLATPGALALASTLLPKKKAMKIEEIPAKTEHPGAKRIKLVYGPYVLRAANGTQRVGNGISMDKGGTGYQYMVDDDFPRDITVLETTSRLQDEKFKRADTKDGIYNHHNVFMDFAPPPASAFACSSGQKPAGLIPMSVLMAGATEDGTISYAARPGASFKSGYYLSKDRKVLNMIDVINYNDVERTVYVEAEMEFLPGKQEGFLEARQERIDPGLCGGQNGVLIHAPKGQTKFSVNSTGVVAARDGYFINQRGHLHDGGIDIILQVNDKTVCDSKAVYGGEGATAKTEDGKVWETISNTLTCTEPVKVSKGDKLFMEAHYDLDLHPSRKQGGHGSMGGMKRWADVFNDGGEAAEQMALMVTHFAYAP